MDFKILDSRTKILFLISVIFLYAALGTFITLTFSSGIIHILFLVLTLWFASASSLIFHYLLWKNLEFLRNININNFGFIISICSYIILFPIICLLTISFLFIFSIIVLILVVNNLIKKTSRNNNSSVNFQ
ncbi:hypothetical protein [Spiroplasma endosymbiont of Danaus chrysippus]|uniref:hypothetical protein n=1 Tax=Spiroplasma endosymbiont of Danaus chrysippus TaxID=2691041 RepID=UPI00157A4179|nr:hypothetical protein [Spiroplasma endosymbiont of Danaus chrysippus]